MSFAVAHRVFENRSTLSFARPVSRLTGRFLAVETRAKSTGKHGERGREPRHFHIVQPADGMAEPALEEILIDQEGFSQEAAVKSPAYAHKTPSTRVTTVDALYSDACSRGISSDRRTQRL